jgi:hypothetical protein
MRGRVAAVAAVAVGVLGLAGYGSASMAGEAQQSRMLLAADRPTEAPCNRGHPCPTTTTEPPTSSTSTTTSTSSSTTTTTSTTVTSTDPAGQLCTSPYFTTSDTNGGITDGGYYVHNNLWNAAKYPGTTGTTSVCSFHSWNHTAQASNASGTGEVKTYPNVHKDYSEPAISSLPALTSKWSMQSPGVGIYNVAYDLWLNGVPGSPEVMIWTENHNQRPAGDVVARGLSFGGYTWDLWATSGNGYLAFTAPPDATSAQSGWPSNEVRSSGQLDLLAMLRYLQSVGRVSSVSTLGQVCFGIEVVDTGGGAATWHLTDFAITDQ